MPRSQATKLYRTFVKGLITEASPLTYPEDTSFDEDNTLLFQKGNRTRRLGVDFEDNFTLSSFQDADPSTTPIIEYAWPSVNNDALTSFLCLQVGGTIYFYNLYANPVSSGLKGFSIDLATYAAAGATAIDKSPIQMTSGKGFLFIAGSKIDPLIVEYRPLTDTITIERVAILIRDFKGVDDLLAVDEEPTTLSNEHKYNLINQGWLTSTTTPVTSYTVVGRSVSAVVNSTTQDTINKYKTVIGRYPGNNKQWILGKMAVDEGSYKVGDFNPTLLNKAHVGNGRAPRGHFIIDAFKTDRSAVSGVPSLTADIKTYRPTSCAFFSGRVWWFSADGVYFSQVLVDKSKAGQCFQEADPTAEDINELIATDGGYIPLPSADEIMRGMEIGNGVMAFARNGVWMISGSDKGFSAIEYQVTKISAIGTDAPYSIVAAAESIFWWSKVGIHQIKQAAGQFGPISGSYTNTNITTDTIDTRFKEVDAQSRQYVKGVYDPATNTLHYVYRSPAFSRNYGYDRFLNLDLGLGAFYPWSLTAGAYPYICGVFLSPDLNYLSNGSDVQASSNNVTDASANQVVAQATELSARPSFLHLVAAVPSAGVYRFSMGAFSNDQFVDWEGYDGTGATYNSFVESGYEILEDAFRKKQILYMSIFFRQTEENFVSSGSGDYTVDKPSSCYMTIKWDWTSSGNTGKWSQKRQVYRHRRVPYVNDLDLTFNTGTKVVFTKNKIRGTGRALQFRFETNERGKNFDLLGWQAGYQGSSNA
jgi:hypothetical protein